MELLTFDSTKPTSRYAGWIYDCHHVLSNLVAIAPGFDESVVSISYDRNEPRQDEQAMACYKHLLGALNEQGYSYRLGIQAMSELSSNDGYGGLLRKIKNAVDPNGVLAPGRYQAM
jgi:FAD/FMN-containing dehydrogenase